MFFSSVIGRGELQLDEYKEILLVNQGYQVIRITNSTVFRHLGDAIKIIKNKL